MEFFLFYLYRFFASERGTDKEEVRAAFARLAPALFLFVLRPQTKIIILAWSRLATTEMNQ